MGTVTVTAAELAPIKVPEPLPGVPIASQHPLPTGKSVTSGGLTQATWPDSWDGWQLLHVLSIACCFWVSFLLLSRSTIA